MARRKEKKPRRWVRRLLIAGLAAVTLAALFVLVTWPDVASLADENPTSTAFIDRARTQGVEIRWQQVPFDQISIEVKKAVLVGEDLSFFAHNGFDTHEIKIAARDAVKGKRVRGASTITQQLAKNLWLSPSRNPTRKLREILLTRQLEKHLTKQRILELYLNVVEFGPGIYGVEAASRHYFGIPAADLDSEQGAQLAASLPRPSSWHPGVSSSGYERAVGRIRVRVGDCDWLDKHL
jgi:monofunctional biosynthetic peptidoglycan transglycosylase